MSFRKFWFGWGFRVFMWCLLIFLLWSISPNVKVTIPKIITHIYPYDAFVTWLTHHPIKSMYQTIRFNLDFHLFALPWVGSLWFESVWTRLLLTPIRGDDTSSFFLQALTYIFLGIISHILNKFSFGQILNELQGNSIWPHVSILQFEKLFFVHIQILSFSSWLFFFLFPIAYFLYETVMTGFYWGVFTPYY